MPMTMGGRIRELRRRHGAKRDLSLSQIEKMTFFFNFIIGGYKNLD